MNVNLEYYRIFYYVVKYGSFTKAAGFLGSSQPNITRAMNNLEGETRCKLFIRTNRGARLTPEGEKLYAHISAAMLQIQEAENEMSVSTGLIHGSISIGASETALSIYLLSYLKNFHMTYPGIRLKIHNYSTPQAIRAVKEGEVDFAVVTTPADAFSPLKKIRLKTFCEVLVGGNTFRALASQELSLAQLNQYPLICLGRETMTWRFYHELFLKYGLELSPDTEAATADQILPLVKCELGMAFVPEPMALEDIERQSIVKIRVREKIPERDVCMVYDRQRPLSAAAQMLKDVMLSDSGNLK